MSHAPTPDQLDAFLARTQQNVLTSDFLATGSVSLANDDATLTLDTLRAYQRLHRINSTSADADGNAVNAKAEIRLADPKHAWATALLADGLQSAQQIAALPEFQFAKRFENAFGDEAQAAEFHQKAVARTSLVHHLWANIKDSMASPHYRATRFYNVSSRLESYYTDIPSYQDLFGTLDYIACSHCDSIFGPAAYFTDLMRIADLYVTLPNSGAIPDKFKLIDRRPDLFERKLDCANTDHAIPFLSIVVDVLGRRIKDEVKGDPQQAVAVAPYPLNLPYNAPLFEVRDQLTHLNVTLAQLYAEFGASAAASAREYLGMSAETAQLVSEESVDPAVVARLYGYTTLDIAELSKVSVFLERTGLTRTELRDLLEQSMTSDELNKLARQFFINAGDSDPYMRVVVDTSDPSNPFEKIEYLTANRLARLNRFIRLSRMLGWSYADTNWIMVQAFAKSKIGDALDALARVQRLRARTALPADAATALFYQVKNVGRAGRPPADLFDRIFNAPALLTGDPYQSGAKEPFDPAQPLTWTIAGSTREDNLIRRRLLAALGLTDNDLTTIANYAACLTGKSGTLDTDLPTLSLLYRLAKTAQAAAIGVSDYFMLLRLMYAPSSACADRPDRNRALTPSDVEYQLDVIDWTKASGFSAPHLQYVMTGVAEPGFDRGYDPEQIRPFVNSLSALSVAARVAPASFVFESLDAERSAELFNGLVKAQVLTDLGILVQAVPVFDTVAALLPVSAQFVADTLGSADSAAAFTALVAQKLIASLSADTGALSAAFSGATDLSFLFPGDPNAAYKRDQVRATLLRVRSCIDHSLQVLASFEALQNATAEQGVAGFFSTGAAMLAELVPIAAGADDLTGYLPLLLTPIPADQPIPPNLVALIATLGRAKHLVVMLQLTVAELAGIRAHPVAYGFPSDGSAFKSLTIDEVRSLWTFKQQVSAFKDRGEALVAYFGMPDDTAPEIAAKRAALAALTGWDAGQIETLSKLYWGDGKQFGTVAGVERLRRAFAQSAATGLAVPSLIQLADLSTLTLITGNTLELSAWDKWRAAAASTLAAVNAHVGDADFPAILKGLTDASQTALRDAYAPYLYRLLQNWNPEGFKRPSDLYQYLLIDVEMTSCDAVSVIAQGIASLQLYLQRCRLGIEPGIQTLPIPEVWWSWMSQYRVWEVNRKVFLYPENYIDPTLRQSRSPQFARLQEALLQNDVRDDTVQAAMRGYLDGFATLAGLRVVGCYRIDVTDETGDDPIDTLFVVGRTGTSPGEYYWRTVKQFNVRQRDAGTWTTQADWGNWQKVGITIPAPYVTPVYAFGRLMLFWVEFERLSGSIINSKQQSEDHTAWTALLRYSFLDFRGEWVAAQTAQTSSVVDFVPNTAYLEEANVDPITLSPQQMYWQRVYALHVPEQQSTFNNGLEQLIVMWGRLFLFFPNQGITPVKPQEGDPFSNRRDLNEDIYQTVQVASALEKTPGSDYRGYVAMKNGLTMASTLLPQEQTTAVLDHAPTQSPFPGYAPALSSGATLIVQEMQSALVADYFANYADKVPKAGGSETLLAATPLELLSKLSSSNRAIWSVKNQPGWFVYDNGDDVFLATSRQTPLYRISQIVRGTGQVAPLQSPWPVQFLYTMPYTSNPTPIDQLKFAFTRLGTHTVGALSQRLFTGGISSLLSIDAQRTPELPFSRLSPTAAAINATRDDLDFNGAYGAYFWEIFFHTVLLVATRLTNAKRFDEAKAWYEYVFDPTAKDNDAQGEHDFDRFWRFLPFRGFTQESLIEMLTNVQQIAAYQRNPFDPDAIARLRHSTYPKATVMRYIDNLIKWGDALFAQDTRESITQAVNLYILASDLLGRRPENVRVFKRRASMSFGELRALYDTSGTAQAGSTTTITFATSASAVDYFYNGLQVQITAGTGATQRRTIGDYAGATRIATVTQPWDTAPDATSQYHILSIPTFLIDLENTPALAQAPRVLGGGKLPYNDINAYFCVPENDELVAYWDTVEDRLFKVRHCMNLQGVVRPLALFEPPLDVRSVIRAAAAGSGGLNLQQNATQSIPFYRFETMIERAKELAHTVSGLGGALLSALQSSDAEQLNLLHTTQERAILDLTTQIRTDQINEVIQNQASLALSRAGAVARLDYYQQLAQKGLSHFELLGLQSMGVAALFNVLGTATRTAASVGYAVPQVGSPFAMTYGGAQIGNMLNAMSGVFEMGAYLANYVAQRSETMGAYERRGQDWGLQATIAENDIRQIDAQIAANDTARAIAEREFAVHRRSIAQNQELEVFFRRRFTNRELYDWIAGRASTVYFQTYTLALDLARAAQSAYQYEMNSSETFIQYDYRDATYRGLFAGEGLMLSLNQMQWNWLNKRARTLEIEKTISLSQLNPRALLDLREQGECRFELSELLFDHDFPGHYCRKIKSISLTLPAVVGPYESVKATLTQQSNQIVLSNKDADAVRFLLGENPGTPPGPDRLRTDWWINQQIALSSGVNDAGLFELNFNDPRYLPFEETGAVSSWVLSMPKAANRFDYASLTDVVISLRYTALDGGKQFRNQVTALAPVKRYDGGRLSLLARQFPAEWFAFTQSRPTDGKQTVQFTIPGSIVPAHVSNAQLTGVYLQLLADVDAANGKPYLSLSLPGTADIPVTIGAHNAVLIGSNASDFGGTWSLTFNLNDTPDALKKDGFIDPAVLKDAALVAYFKGDLQW